VTAQRDPTTDDSKSGTDCPVPERPRLLTPDKAHLLLRTVRPRRALTAAVLVLGLTATTVPAAVASPPSAAQFGAPIDAYARYEAQRTCLSQEQPGTAGLRSLVMSTYPNTGRGGILRGCRVGGRSEHKEGRAWDWMVNAHNPTQKAQADELLAWLLATDEHGNRHALARRFGVMYIIWNRKVWKAYRPNDGWQPYSGANPHTDHVHFSLGWDGAKQRTSFWTASSLLATAPPPPLPGPFKDVPRSATHHESIAWLLETGIAVSTRDGNFRPSDVVTRAQMAAWLWRLMGSPTGAPAHGFSDVPADAAYEHALRWLAASGVTQGVTDQRFDPGGSVTREQMATFLWRLSGRSPSSGDHGFTDVSSERSPQVSWLREHGITGGITSDRFGGSQATTRGQMSTFLFKLAGTESAWSAPPPPTARF
jgi:hypothetical protein